MGFFCLHLHYNKENKKAKQVKSGAIRTVCVNFVPYRLFRGGLGRMCLNSRTRRPSPKTPPYIVYQNRASPYRLDGDFCHLYIEDCGVIRFVGVEQRSEGREAEDRETEQSKSGVGNATSVASEATEVAFPNTE